MQTQNVSEMACHPWSLVQMYNLVTMALRETFLQNSATLQQKAAQKATMLD